ncbi:hypothetical protein NDU88_002244 [Pleurodeles waltl]|uniref:Uncharacterized protein n=1 Tax=Pleurodeles waltl TaxID=8319 RepID=A0AAV7RDY8_PLEWA|nr:hypothetical protein NDU88_002244 [Pleurodeles waltl]
MRPALVLRAYCSFAGGRGNLLAPERVAGVRGGLNGGKLVERTAGTGAGAGIGSPRDDAPRLEKAWRRPVPVSAQRWDDSVSRIEIQQDGTMRVVDPEKAVELAGSSDMEAGVLYVDA